MAAMAAKTTMETRKVQSHWKVLEIRTFLMTAPIKRYVMTRRGKRTSNSSLKTRENSPSILVRVMMLLVRVFLVSLV